MGENGIYIISLLKSVSVCLSEKSTSQNGDNESVCKCWFRNYNVAHAFVVCNDYYSVMCDVFEILLSYISIHITHTDDFPLTGYPACSL